MDICQWTRYRSCIQAWFEIQHQLTSHNRIMTQSLLNLRRWYLISKLNEWFWLVHYPNLHLSLKICMHIPSASVHAFQRKRNLSVNDEKISVLPWSPLSFRLSTPPMSWSFPEALLMWKARGWKTWLSGLAL